MYLNRKATESLLIYFSKVLLLYIPFHDMLHELIDMKISFYLTKVSHPNKQIEK